MNNYQIVQNLNLGDTVCTHNGYGTLREFTVTKTTDARVTLTSVVGGDIRVFVRSTGREFGASQRWDSPELVLEGTEDYERYSRIIPLREKNNQISAVIGQLHRLPTQFGYNEDKVIELARELEILALELKEI